MVHCSEKMKFLFCLLAILLVQPVWASTPLDPLLGVRVSLLASEHLLADPPLPDLSKSARPEATLGASYLAANLNSAGSVSQTYYSGHFSGESISLGYKFTGSRNVGYFVFLAGSSIKGSSNLGSTSFVTSLNDFNTSTFVGMMGLSYRILGADRSPLALGLLTGIGGSTFSSSFNVSSTGDTSSVSYGAKPTIYGAMAGAQIAMHFGKIFINPYALYFQELSKKCKAYSTSNTADDGSGFDSTCFASTGPRTIGLSASFFAYGANVGYDNFTLNIYSQVAPDSSMSSITFNNFSLSYDF